MAREFFCAYHSLTDTTRCLNDAEFGRLMRAAISYSASGESPTLSGREAVLWDMVRWQIDRDIEKYQAFADKQTENGKKGGRPKKTEETQETHGFSEKPKKAYTKENDPNKKPSVSITPLSPLEGAVKAFCDHRKKLRKPMTDHAIDLFRKRLEELAPSNEEKQIELINTAIERGWQTVYIPDEKKPSARKLTGSNAPYAQRKYSDADFEDIFVDLSRVEV
jgi:hypothetical protein